MTSLDFSYEFLDRHYRRAHMDINKTSFNDDIFIQRATLVFYEEARIDRNIHSYLPSSEKLLSGRSSLASGTTKLAKAPPSTPQANSKDKIKETGSERKIAMGGRVRRWVGSRARFLVKGDSLFHRLPHLSSPLPLIPPVPS